MRKFMIYTAALASVSLITLSTAMAQTTTATGTGTSNSNSGSQSSSSAAGVVQGSNVQNGNSVSSGTGVSSSRANTRSSSSSAATGNRSTQNSRLNNGSYSGVDAVFVNNAGGGGDPGGYAGGGNGQPYGSTSWSAGDTTVRTAPTVYAPPVSGGNPCTLAVSGGVSVIGWGAAAGGTFVDQDCADRQKIAMIWNAGYKEAAKELMCNDQKTYMAFRTAGQPCAPRAEWEPRSAAALPVVAPVPVVTPAAAPQPPAPKVMPRCRPPQIVDNCYSG